MQSLIGVLLGVVGLFEIVWAALGFVWYGLDPLVLIFAPFLILIGVAMLFVAADVLGD